MRILGAVLAGGRSSRFGSDKALAEWNGRTLLEGAIAALRPQCDDICVVGRSDAPVAAVADWPQPDCGPLGGMAGALRYALSHDFDQVLSIPVDVVELPPDLRQQLSPAPAYLLNLPVAGLWRTAALPALEAILTGPGRRSVRSFADACGARGVTLHSELSNINTLADLERLRAFNEHSHLLSEEP